jgi:phage-related protein
MNKDVRLSVAFYRETSGKEPVREWLHALDRVSKRIIGEDIKTVQFAWPLGMPLVRALGSGLWEVRSHLTDVQARIIFMIEGSYMVLLHGFIKKSRTTPKSDLELARKRAMNVKRHG